MRGANIFFSLALPLRNGRAANSESSRNGMELQYSTHNDPAKASKIDKAQCAARERLRRSNSPDKVFLLKLGFRPDREGIKKAQCEREMERLVLPVA